MLIKHPLLLGLIATIEFDAPFDAQAVCAKHNLGLFGLYLHGLAEIVSVYWF